MQGTVKVLRGQFAGGLGEGHAEGSDRASADEGKPCPAGLPGMASPRLPRGEEAEAVRKGQAAWA